MEDSEYIDLCFGDQSHFGPPSNVSYATKTKENSLMLPATKGKYQNVVGLMIRKTNSLDSIANASFFKKNSDTFEL